MHLPERRLLIAGDREDIQAVLESEFDWGRLGMAVGLDGVITQMR